MGKTTEVKIIRKTPNLIVHFICTPSNRPEVLVLDQYVMKPAVNQTNLFISWHKYHSLSPKYHSLSPDIHLLNLLEPFDVIKKFETYLILLTLSHFLRQYLVLVLFNKFLSETILLSNTSHKTEIIQWIVPFLVRRRTEIISAPSWRSKIPSHTSSSV